MKYNVNCNVFLWVVFVVRELFKCLKLNYSHSGVPKTMSLCKKKNGKKMITITQINKDFTSELSDI